MFNARAVPTLRAIASRVQPAISRSIASSHPAYADKSGHSAESYFKDVDSEPPKDSTVHRVDSSSDKVQRPYEPPAGSYSETGVDAAFTYKTVDKEEPYDVPGDSQGDQKMGYGGTERYSKDKARESSKPEDGPTGASAGGRKPEGR